jgi:hypothetical protein
VGAANFSVSYFIKDSGKNATGYDLANDFDGRVTLLDLYRFTKNALITISPDVLKEEQAKGFDKEPTLIVDNKFNKKLADVHPLGKIEYVARAQFREIIVETYRKILYYSPNDTGRYFNGNWVTFNGARIANSMPSLEAWLRTKKDFTPNDIIRFVNIEPYARKLEGLGITRQKRKAKTAIRRRKKGGRRRVGVPNGAYAMAYSSVKRRFKKNVYIGFDLLPGNKIGIEGPPELTKFHGKKAEDEGYAGQFYIFPTIIIRAVQAGLTDAGGMLQ